jgi:hypothetical protein
MITVNFLLQKVQTAECWSGRLPRFQTQDFIISYVRATTFPTQLRSKNLVTVLVQRVIQDLSALFRISQCILPSHWTFVVSTLSHNLSAWLGHTQVALTQPWPSSVVNIKPSFKSRILHRLLPHQSTTTQTSTHLSKHQSRASKYPLHPSPIFSGAFYSTSPSFWLWFSKPITLNNAARETSPFQAPQISVPQQPTASILRLHQTFQYIVAIDWTV